MKPWQFVFKKTTQSTNADAVNIVREGSDCAGTVVWAAEQTGGKGRYGRIWDSPKGNLYCSFIVPNSNTNFAGFACALAVVDTLKDQKLAAKVTCKWPNDVLADGKKVSGILLEVCEDMLIIGIGINLGSYPADAAYAAGCLADFGLAVEAEDFLGMLAVNLQRNLDLVDVKGFAPVRKKWFEYAHNLGCLIRVNLINESTSGIFTGISEQGALQLKTANGIRNIMAGDVFYL